mgnify:CR=1 FL=1
MAALTPIVGPELRQLAQTILTADPIPRLTAGRHGCRSAAGLQRQQVWCPVCALAALVSGEQHPLLTVIAEHSVALLTVVRAMVERHRDDTRAPMSRRPMNHRRRVRAGISTSR